MPRSPSRANTRALLAPFGTSGLAPAGPAPDVASYDHILIFLSGGKDSIACIDAVLAAGADPAQIELHHHDVDGAGGALMDWPVTASYCRALAASFGLPLFTSWKEGGFLREMLRDNLPTAPIHYQSPSGRHIVGGQGPRNTRLRFPQLSADLSVRWCSAYLKIMVADALIRGDDRFLGRRTLVVTGERAEESPSRARYATFEPHRTDTRDGTRRRRHVDHWRPVHRWREAHVWDAVHRHGIVPHVGYQLGWRRLSCMACIFMSADQAASIRFMAPYVFTALAGYEQAFGCTIKRGRSLAALADRGRPYEQVLMRPDLVQLALSARWDQPIRIAPKDWMLPAGAFGENAGPS
jgi:3'-phosphoadenosine 5'-phosphosulfate sulfotransferase (PAPS reductase)/FAD synthetase